MEQMEEQQIVEQPYEDDIRSGKFHYIDPQQSNNQVYVESRGQIFQGWNSQLQISSAFNAHQLENEDNPQANSPVINRGVEELIKKYDVRSPTEEDRKEDSLETKLEAVSFGFRNEKIKENLIRDFHKLRVKHKRTRSEGVIIFYLYLVKFHYRDP